MRVSGAIGAAAAAAVFVAVLVFGPDAGKVTGVAVEAPPPPTPTATTTTRPVARAVLKTAENPLLGNGISLREITCELPKFGRAAEQLRSYYKAMVTCMDDAWRPALEQANLPFSSPELNMEDKPTTGCGPAPSDNEATAFYCGADRTIYVPRATVLDAVESHRAGHLNLLGHEYGHHVQLLSGIALANGSAVHKAGEDTPAGLELIRRQELQANCFSGLFIAAAAGRGTVTKQLADAAARSFNDSVADNTHGKLPNQVRWGNDGFRKRVTSACNTYNAPSAQVA
ncbi:neutral zinc metallopeptidase [Allokutzneria sp. NRRL B-24872]|uniref:neutral zinc metallopeptidase n=1 Tax=Allokutzneria sp. NRRL B-24872 TaxID=1137961 RepID=UPI000A3BA3A6|nr:neutral zinc metallopeptidase [Allokutzneria sp. NRRL B-24872]